MGDRALIQFVKAPEPLQQTRERPPEWEYSPVCYVHWHGPEVPDILVQCAALMADRRYDTVYAFARFVGIAHTWPGLEGDNLSLGCWNADGVLTRNDSHGDSGVFVVKLPEWKVLSSRRSDYDAHDLDIEALNIKLRIALGD